MQTVGRDTKFRRPPCSCQVWSPHASPCSKVKPYPFEQMHELCESGSPENCSTYRVETLISCRCIYVCIPLAVAAGTTQQKSILAEGVRIGTIRAMQLRSHVHDLSESSLNVCSERTLPSRGACNAHRAAPACTTGIRNSRRRSRSLECSDESAADPQELSTLKQGRTCRIVLTNAVFLQLAPVLFRRI